jgi:hypothetical protein
MSCYISARCGGEAVCDRSPSSTSHHHRRMCSLYSLLFALCLSPLYRQPTFATSSTSMMSGSSARLLVSSSSITHVHTCSH